MRIALVGPFGLHPKGTMAVRALLLARALAQRGQRVRVVLPPWDCPSDARHAREENSTIKILVDVDSGLHRTGVASIEDAVELAKLTDRLPNLEFEGIMVYPGHLGSSRSRQVEVRVPLATQWIVA